ncbi:hypothetical protein N7494_013299 [Penicillium frequentans]|uniref:PARP-type domain-containing protein n=1 Tax=Penicillium frequentans TaxID=3151616 RepID=A0AAD6CI04_9EURO|nr:hypothetical protein N7494_013299 [Penicillium glabrum]
MQQHTGKESCGPTAHLGVKPPKRAECRNQECPAPEKNILAGSLHVGSWVATKKYGYFRWYHWNCIPPSILDKINEWRKELCSIGKDPDGWGMLPEDFRAKVHQALENRHVDDKDSNSDVDMNRPRRTSPISKTRVAPKDNSPNSACNNSAIAVEEEVGKKPRKGPEKASNSGSHTGPKRGSTEIEGADDNQPFQAPKKAGQKTTKTNRPTRTNPTVEGRLFSPSVGLCER